MATLAEVLLLVMNYTPTFAAFWGGIVTAVILSMLRKETRLNLTKLVHTHQAAGDDGRLGRAAPGAAGNCVGQVIEIVRDANLLKNCAKDDEDHNRFRRNAQGEPSQPQCLSACLYATIPSSRWAAAVTI